jgi:histidine triad (HIT) family protein
MGSLSTRPGLPNSKFGDNEIVSNLECVRAMMARAPQHHPHPDPPPSRGREGAEDCVFCRIVAGDSPSEAIFEDAASLAFMDINPANDGHCLVVPKAHFANVLEMPPNAFGAVAAAAATVARAVDAVLRPAGLSLVQANGAAAGQTVFHLHIHVLPRCIGDDLLLNWDRKGSGGGDRRRIAEIAERLRARLRVV